LNKVDEKCEIMNTGNQVEKGSSNSLDWEVKITFS